MSLSTFNAHSHKTRTPNFSAEKSGVFPQTQQDPYLPRTPTLDAFFWFEKVRVYAGDYGVSLQ